MAPKVRKYNIEASKKGRRGKQGYGSQYDGKGPPNDHQNQQKNQNMGVTTQEEKSKMTTVK